MAQIIKEIRVDVSQPCNLQAILAKQYDCNSRFLKITLTDCGTKIDVSNTSKVTINTNRPDGQSKSFVGIANDDGTVTVPLPQWSLSIAGTLICDVSVTDISKNERLTTMDIFVEVKEAANDNTDVSENPDGEIIVITPTKKISENSTDNEYPSAKAVYELDNITATASGKAITVDSANAPLQNLKLYGKTTQNGTPTPDNPIELKSVGDSGSFEVGVYGKNWFDIGTDFSEYFTTTGGYTISTNKGVITTAMEFSFKDNTIVVDKYIAPPYVWLSKFIDLTPNTYYTISAESAFAGARIYGADSNTLNTVGKELVYISGIVQPTTFNSGNYKYYWISFYPAEVGKVLSKCQVELGSQATPFEEYKSKQSITFTDTLRGVDDVKDEAYFNKGVKTQSLVEVDLGTLNYTYDTTELRFTGYTTLAGVSQVRKTKGLCEIYKVLSNGDTYNKDWNNVLYLYGNQVQIHDKRYTDASALKTALSGVKLVYELATPIETPLTETELNAYRQLYTNKGTTNVLSEADAEISFYRNTPNGQATGNIHTQVNADYFKLQQAIITTGGSTL